MQAVFCYADFKNNGNSLPYKNHAHDIINLTDITNINKRASIDFGVKGVFMPLDIEKYKRHLSSTGWSEARKDEFVRTVATIMESFVDSAFGIHPVQLAVKEKKRDSRQESGVLVKSKNSEAENNFNGTIQAESE